MERIIFFDGICVLCDGFVSYLFNIDKKRLFKFAPLQSNTAARLLSKQDLGLNTIVYYENGQTYTQSTAVLRILKQVNFFWRVLAGLLAVFPKNFSDHVYDLVARNRYSWFGKNEVCRLPTPEEKFYFLD